jgi:hypothetical protein
MTGAGGAGMSAVTSAASRFDLRRLTVSIGAR